MTIELVKITYKGTHSYAAINYETGRLEREFSWFISWLALNHDTRENSRTRGCRPARHSIRQYLYALKAWFDWIEDWNASAVKNNCESKVISWHTACPDHREMFISMKKDAGIGVIARNQYRTVFKLFYTDFCSYLKLSHFMTSGISTYKCDCKNPLSKDSGNILANYGGKGKANAAGKKVTVQENVPEKLTVTVVDIERLNTLMNNFSDPVYSHIVFFMLSTGLRSQPVIDIPYPGSQPKDNPNCTDPFTLKNDYKIEDYFELNYVYKGQSETGVLYQVDVPFDTWEAIWNAYKPMLDKRTVLWRKKAKEKKNLKDHRYQGRKPSMYWLTETGKPVTKADLQTEFRAAIAKIHDKNNPDYDPGFPKFIILMHVESSKHFQKARD